jgi:uncharacterized coiled-coil DUF342 family protein
VIRLRPAGYYYTVNVDERLQFLLQSSESLHENVAKLVERVDQVAEHVDRVVERVDKLAETSDRHEREITRFRRAMRAALAAWLDEEGEAA